jgi:hypothetical protein
MQWFGKKQVDKPGTTQKPIWIEPYYKGLELPSEDKETIYVVR